MEEETKKHISYKEYKRKINEKPNDGIVIFVSSFFILLLLFLGIAKQISPDVDVTIADDNSNEQKSEIDERLKLLQTEDNDKMFSPELDEKIVIPDFKKTTEEEEVTEEEEQQQFEEVSKQPETIPPTTVSTTATTTSNATAQPAKVIVGYYTTKEQAEVAKDILTESGLNISPFVRGIGGAYTIQVGSFASREKAQSLANELLRNNYPARIITE